MATYYSSLYGVAPNASAGTAPAYKGPTGPVHAGEVQLISGTFSNVAATPFGGVAGDALKICPLPPGSKVGRVVIAPSADLDAANTFTFNLGTTTVANAIASASTGLQAAAAYSVLADANIAMAPAVDGDELILTRAAGSLGTAGTLRFIAEVYQP